MSTVLCTAAIGLTVIVLNLMVFAFYLDMARNVGLAGTGSNTACQSSTLHRLDMSVCQDDRLPHLFLIYTDGSPFLFYEALLKVPTYRDIAVAKVSENPGINDSGPSFRSSLIGRFDIDYASDLRQLDNHLHQFLRNTGSPMELELYFHFPVLPNIKDDSFSKVHFSPDHNEGLTELCPDFFVNHPFPSNLGCVDPLACQFDTEAAAMQFVAEETEKHVSSLQPKKQLLKKCLDEQFASSPSLFVYQEKTDDLAHSWSIKNKVTTTLQAKSLANLRAVIDYLLDSRPDTLIAVYSDHGQAKEMWDDEWVNHGYPSGYNNGFLILINERLRSKPKQQQTGFESAATLFSQMTLLLKNSNLPKYQKTLPNTWFPTDDFERLKMLRAREMQMAQVLAANEFESSPFHSLDWTLDLKENIRRMDRARLSRLVEEYVSFLESKESHFESRVSEIRSPYSKLQKSFSIAVFLLDLLLVYRMATSYAKREHLLRSPFVVMFLWFSLLMGLTPLSSYAFPATCSLFLLLLVGMTKVPKKWQQLHHLLSLVDLVASKRLKREELASLRASLAALASVPLIVGSGFLVAYRLDAFRHAIYFLSGPWEVAGFLCAALSSLLLVLYLFTNRTAEAERQQTRLIFSKIRLQNGALALSSAVLIYMLVLTARYEKRIFEKSSLHHDHEQMLLVQQVYWSLVVLMLVFSCALPNSQSKLACFAAAYLFFTFWSTHLSRVLYSLAFIPVAMWVSWKQVSNAGFGLLWAAVSVLGAGMYTANGEAYLFTVSQRAFKRHPMENPDRDLAYTVLNTFFIKFGSSILLQQFLQLLKPRSLPKQLEAAYLLFVVALYIPCSYVMASQVASQQTFVVYLGANILVPFIVMMHRWAVDAVSSYLHFAPVAEQSNKQVVEDEEREPMALNLQQTSMLTCDEERDCSAPTSVSQTRSNQMRA